MNFGPRFCHLQAAAVALVAVLSAAERAYARIGVSAFAANRTSTLVYNLSDGSNPSKTIEGQEFGGSFWYQPWLRLPVSLGVTGISYSLNTGDIANTLAADDLGNSIQYFSTRGSGTLEGLIYGPQLTVWIPFNYVQPYLRVAQMSGTEVNSMSNNAATLGNVSPVRVIESSQEDSFEVATTMISVGFSLSPIRILSFTHEGRFPSLVLARDVSTVAIFSEYSLETGYRIFSATSRSTSSTTDGSTTTTSSERISAKEILDQESNSTMVRLGIEYQF